MPIMDCTQVNKLRSSAHCAEITPISQVRKAPGTLFFSPSECQTFTYDALALPISALSPNYVCFPQNTYS